ncbi:MAG: hypothetical protein IJK05_08940, partial [Bacteroidales bacterium]|nr:hypothetical protein [Bacteroidales bacterium]
MVTLFKRLAALLAALFLGAAAFAQAPEATATWRVSSKPAEPGEFELVFTATIEPGWHIYTVDHKYNPTSLEFDSPEGYTPVGTLGQVTSPTVFGEDNVFFDTAVFSQKVKLDAPEATVKGEITWSACDERFCAAPEHWEFTVKLDNGTPIPDGENRATLGSVRGGTTNEVSGG